jgi:L-histidine Nalpha-methyltransferase
MSSSANVTIHASQFPENVRRDLRVSLRARRVNHKFLYDSVRQTQQWLALHEAHSPARYDKDCRATYGRAFAKAAGKIKSKHIHVIGLGCGGGQKDTRLLKLLRAAGKEVYYTPCDVSTAMSLVARQAALSVLPENRCFPLVCDLATADDLPAILVNRHPSPVTRLITFFGMIPNFEPQLILPRLAGLVRPTDFLLFSANLAPDSDYAAGMKKILPQYDNPLTRDWLMTFLLDLGVERDDGELRFTIETGSSRRKEALKAQSPSPKPRANQRLLTSSPTTGKIELKRITAYFHFTRHCRIRVQDEGFDYRVGDSIQLFFSYRHTPERVRMILQRHGLDVREQWITKSEEEGVFLCNHSP